MGKQWRDGGGGIFLKGQNPFFRLRLEESGLSHCWQRRFCGEGGGHFYNLLISF